MKRLFYLVYQMDSVESISEDLHKEGITDWRFHVLSRDEAGLFTRKLHSASIFDPLIWRATRNAAPSPAPCSPRPLSWPPRLLVRWHCRQLPGSLSSFS